MTTTVFELDCNTCGGVFFADRSTLGADDYLIRNGQVVRHDCPSCRQEKEPMTTDSTTLTDDLHEAMTAEAEAWKALEIAKLFCLGVEAREGMEIRRKAVADGARITEAQHDAWVTLNAEVVAARLAVVDAESHYRLMKADVAQVEAQVSLAKSYHYSLSGRSDRL